MSKLERTITPRGYQKVILDLIKFHTKKKKNVLLELDCGMGKRVITYKLITSLFPKKKILLVVLSSSSLHETKEFLVNEYGGVEGFKWLGPRTSGKYAAKLLEEGRVILSTPQKLANILAKQKQELAEAFDILVINEVDKLIRRMGDRRVLIYPWSDLLRRLEKATIIGMSGTLRDSHYVLDRDQIEIRKELDTLTEFIPSTEIIFMEYLAGTDIKTYTKETVIDIAAVDDTAILALSSILDQQLKEAYKAIREELADENPEYLVQVKKIGPQALLQAPIRPELRGKAQSLSLLRKYLYAMIPKQLAKFLWKVPDIDQSMLPVAPKKIDKVVEIAKESQKTVVLCSYIKTVKAISAHLTQAKIKPFIVTGRIFDKNAVLQEFRAYSGQATLIMSPVGERDIDLPEADKLIIFDSVRTIKTVYQQLKRIRGGKGVFLYYKDTYEERKIKSVISNLLERYPWSTKMAEEKK